MIRKFKRVPQPQLEAPHRLKARPVAGFLLADAGACWLKLLTAAPMLRNFLCLDEGRHEKVGPHMLMKLDYFVIVKFDTFKVVRDKTTLTSGDELPLTRLDAWVREREKLARRG